MDNKPIKIDMKVPPKGKINIEPLKPEDIPKFENNKKKKIVGKLQPKPK
jgi:hypothetical protein